MYIQEIYDSLTPFERQEFANNNDEVIKQSLLYDDDLDLSGVSKDELLRTIKERRDLYGVINGIFYAGFSEIELNNWLEKQLM